MSLKDFLQGKWLGHPLHPALVHVPTGLFPAATLFDLLARARDAGADETAARCAVWCIVVGLIAALAAAPTGLADWSEIKPDKPARKLGLCHLTLNLAVLALMGASLYLRVRDGVDANATPTSAVACAAAGNVLLAISGYLGGRMVFDQGIGVARLSKKKWRKIAEAGQARLPAE